MSTFNSNNKKVFVNSGIHFFTWMLLFVLFWDFGDIDLYDALIQSLTHEVTK
jgi:hypothetical protein